MPFSLKRCQHAFAEQRYGTTASQTDRSDEEVELPCGPNVLLDFFAC
jgi:hypothetical protein